MKKITFLYLAAALLCLGCQDNQIPRAPVITDVATSDISDNSATCTFSFDPPGAVRKAGVIYGNSENLPSDAPQVSTTNTGSGKISLALTGLNSHTSYSYKTYVMDSKGNCIYSDNYEFTTLVPPAPPTVPVTAITITPSGDVSVVAGQTTTLTATVAPANATNQTITWSSLNTGMATVNAQTGVVTGVNAGTATIRATAADGSNVSADKNVTVTPAEVKVTSITITPSGDVSVAVGQTTTLTATVAPANATNQTITWSSLNTGIATVNAQTGVVTGVSAGTATIRATAADGNGVSADKSITVTSPVSGPEMVSVQGGTFTMGATAEQGSDADSDELPVHQVTVSSFSIGKYQLTQKEWIAIMGNNPSYFKGDNLPVEQVSWNDIVGTSGNYMELNGIKYYEDGFIYKLNTATGKQYRLPTEAEWEYACRGGLQSAHYKYSGSNNVGDVAWYSGNSGNATHPVGSKQANELGIYDMSGNVWEWCSDWYGNYSSGAQTNPTGPTIGSDRVFRGGCWGFGARYCRVSFRSDSSPGFRDYYVGFRLACSSN